MLICSECLHKKFVSAGDAAYRGSPQLKHYATCQICKERTLCRCVYTHLVRERVNTGTPKQLVQQHNPRITGSDSMNGMSHAA